jgi:U3 small nucleolar RNA-associated protein 3
MARKHRSTNASSSAHRDFTVNPKDAKLGAINSWADVADEEDAFHLERDKVLLSADYQSRGRNQGADEEEEVMGLEQYGYESASSDEDALMGDKNKVVDDSSDEDSEGEVELEQGWGSSKKTYYGGQEEIENEQDALDEEEEAKRIQARQMQSMSAVDFAFDDDEWADSSTASPTTDVVVHKKVIMEQLPTKFPDTPEERLKLLYVRHPEFRLLAEEFLDLQTIFPALEMSAKAAETVGETEKTSAVVRKWKVASAYLGVLSMYFAILTEVGKEDSSAIERVREHSIMEALLNVRLAWEKVKAERLERIEPRLESVEEQDEAEAGRKRKRPLDDREEENGDSDSDEDQAVEVVKKKPRATKEDFSDLAALTASFSTSKSKLNPTKKPRIQDVGDFGEDSVLNDIDAEEKTARKKNLRFYTSQIVQKTMKRDRAGREIGGDADIPHRERRKERELRLRAEAQRRRDKGEGADLDGNEPDEDDHQAKKQIEKQGDEDNEYYELVASTSKGRKEQKKALYDAENAAKKAGDALRITEGAIGPDGKRDIGWTIMKNKGLQPKRKKEVRNPRVKKKKQYEAKMKKVGSVKAVYKGGLKGAYGGEMTGIKKNLVKSVKFSS